MITDVRSAVTSICGNETTMTDSVLMTVLEQVKAGVQSLNLAGINAGNIHIVKVFGSAEELLPTLPGVLIAPRETGDVAQGGTNVRMDVGYLVVVGLFAEDGEDQSVNFDRNLRWSERIRRKFVDQRLPGAPSVFSCRLESSEIVDRKRWLSRGLWSSVLGLRFLSRESRA